MQKEIYVVNKFLKKDSSASFWFKRLSDVGTEHIFNKKKNDCNGLSKLGNGELGNSLVILCCVEHILNFIILTIITPKRCIF